ncbi:MAG: GDSL-type esterase/lipase family protein [Janthinobacterium lividum]
MLLLLALLALGLPARAQRGPQQLDSLRALYPFLRPQANYLENATIGLQRFYQRLAPLQLPPGGRVVVVHLGDSHLQADDYSGRVRRELQRTYGNAGRGLVFPYEVARTNGSPTYRTAALAGRWRARRATQLPDTALPVGVSGLVLATSDSGAAFSLRIPALRRPAYAFSQLTLLRAPGPRAFDWQVRGPRGQLLGTVPGAGPSVDATLGLDSLRGEVRLQAIRAQPGQASAALYGLVLENGRPGVLYHGIGVNGAQVRQYNRAPQFWAQLPLLQPDLFIISLGTNDVYDAHYALPRFAAQLDTLVRTLRQRCPLAEVLLVSPADSYRARRAPNPEFGRVAAVLRAYAQVHDLAYWDFAAVQGGYGSMRQWRAAGLAQPDFIHFTTKGYDVQGLLLYLALQDGFAAFRTR